MRNLRRKKKCPGGRVVMKLWKVSKLCWTLLPQSCFRSLNLANQYENAPPHKSMDTNSMDILTNSMDIFTNSMDIFPTLPTPYSKMLKSWICIVSYVHNLFPSVSGKYLKFTKIHKEKFGFWVGPPNLFYGRAPKITLSYMFLFWQGIILLPKLYINVLYP